MAIKFQGKIKKVNNRVGNFLNPNEGFIKLICYPSETNGYLFDNEVIINLNRIAEEDRNYAVKHLLQKGNDLILEVNLNHQNKRVLNYFIKTNEYNKETLVKLY